FGGETDVATAMARLTTSPPSIRAERPDVPPALDDLVHRCLARDPAKRFASAAAVRHALDIVGGTVAPRHRPAAAATPPAAPRPPTSASTAPVAAASPAPRRKRRGSWLWVLLVVIVAAAAGVGAYLFVRDQTSSGGSGSGTNGASTGAPPASQASATVTDFDPYDPDTPKTENPEAVGNVVDGNLTTVWQTSQYVNFAEKPGVGLRFDLDGTYALKSVKVIASQAGWSGSIYVSTKDGTSLTTLGDWGEAVATGSDVAATHQFTVEPSRSARSVLVWFTKLPNTADGQSLAVSEVELA
ncbi:MAG: hypothetical protein ABWY80_01675, partial [Acidimicrobiia bacterium]